MNETKTWGAGKIWAARLAFLAVFFFLWEKAADTKFIDPILIGKPTGIVNYLWQEIFVTQSLLGDFYWSMGGTVLAFVFGSVAGILVGMLFITRPTIEAIFGPILTALNAMPRIALAPLFILWFGLGLGSKIAVGCSLTFFIVLSATVAGIRGVSQDHVTLCRTLGAGAATTFFQVTLPGAVPVIFSGLRLGLIYALLGVVGTEIIASEKGLGQSLAYLGSTFDINGVMALLLVLALLGVAIVRFMTWIEKRLLHWQ